MSNEINANNELDHKIQEWLNWDQVCINDNFFIGLDFERV
jgi:hypothetical protein